MPDPLLREDAAADSRSIDCAMTNAGEDKKWKGPFPWTSDLRRHNRDIFGNSSFRRNQEQAINATLAGKDVFLLMPTGGGGVCTRECDACPADAFTCFGARVPEMHAGAKPLEAYWRLFQQMTIQMSSNRW